VEVAFSHWSASWPALVCYAVVAAAHLTGLRRLRTAQVAASARELRQQALVFHLGLLIALLALVSPVGYFSDVYLWVRALQFLLVAVAATGLMVLGAPWQALRRAVRPASEQRVPVMDGPPAGAPWLVRWPAAAVLVANVIWLAWQLPALLDAAATSPAVAQACHATCLAAGVVFWLQLIGSRPLSPASMPLRRLALIVGTVGSTTILGMVLVFGSTVLYPVYANSSHHVMKLLDDQQLSGAVLWMGVLPALMIVTAALMIRWLSDEESAERSAGLDRLLTPRTNAWSARPGIR
jgi:cytochrome c oxidase assembly factor CtaG